MIADTFKVAVPVFEIWKLWVSLAPTSAVPKSSLELAGSEVPDSDRPMIGAGGGTTAPLIVIDSGLLASLLEIDMLPEYEAAEDVTMFTTSEADEFAAIDIGTDVPRLKPDGREMELTVRTDPPTFLTLKVFWSAEPMVAEPKLSDALAVSCVAPSKS